MVTTGIVRPRSFSQYLKFWSYVYCKVTHNKVLPAGVAVCAKDVLSLGLWISTIAAVTALPIPELLHLSAAGSEGT